MNSSETNYITSSELEPEFILSSYYTEWDIIQTLLISTAITIRLIDDQFIQHNKTIKYPFDTTGNLMQNDNINSLTLREACNKIVHGKKFNPKTFEDKDETYFLAEVQLCGSYASKDWVANVDIRKYVFNALQLSREYEEDWDVSSRNR